MIELATVLPAIAVGPAKPALAIAAGTSNFALALSSLLVPGAPAAATGDPAPSAEVPLPERQPLAGDGKGLPEMAPGLDTQGDGEAKEEGKDEDAPEEAPPPSFAWFAQAVPEAEPTRAAEPAPEAAVAVLPASAAPPRRKVGDDVMPPLPGAEAPVGKAPAVPTTPAVTPASAGPAEVPVQPKASAPIMPAPDAPAPKAATKPVDRPIQRDPKVSAPAAPPAPAPAAPAAPSAQPAASAPARAQPAAIPATAPVPAPAPLPTPSVGPASVEQGAPAPAPGAAPDMPAPPPEFRQSEAPVVRIEAASRTAAARPAVRIPVAPEVVAPVVRQVGEGQVASSASSASSASPAPLLRREAPRAPLPGEAAPIVGTGGAPAAPAVLAAGHGQQPALDTRRQEWTGQMIERIEAMRDAAPVRETKLSLMPEALGKVDVSIRHDDSGVHVHFQTETQAARQLIADAQPKLNEIAEQRGLRLGSTSVESGSAGGAHAGSDQRHGAAPRQSQPSSAPASARAAPSTTETDERIA